MKIISLILSTTMLINSIPCTSLYAQQAAPQDLCTSSPGNSCISGTPTGTDTFKAFMEEKERHGWTFVDKSLLVKEIVDSNDRATLITRPRRWGKSLNLSMLECFFKPELTKDGQRVSKDYRANLGIFEKLKINGGYIDTREIINRILLSQNIDRSFKDYHDTILEIAQNQDFDDKISILQGHREETLQDTTPLKNIIKSYGNTLLNQLSRFDNLPSLLNELNQLHSQMQGTAEHEKKEVEEQYNAKFEAVRQQVETYVENNTDLKAELGKEFDLMARHQGQYPTILLSFRDVKKDTYAEAREKIESQVINLFFQYKYLAEIADWWEEAGKKETKFEDKVRAWIRRNDAGLEQALETLSRWLCQHHGKRTYILIDEYDAAPNHLLFKEGTTQKDIQDVAKLISDILSPLCKGNNFVEKVILTGVFDTLYREAGSGINNVVPYSIMSPRYSDYYGFSEIEIRQRLLSNLSQPNQDTLIQQLKKWYDGYTDKHLYTPWPVVLHLSKVIESCKTQCDYTLKPENYWNQSGAYDSLDKIANIFKKLNQLSQTDIDINNFLFINHPYAETKPSSISVIFDEDEDKADVFRYMLIHFGYLTTKNKAISIPNEEVKTLYDKHFKHWTAVSKPDEFLQFTTPIVQFYINQQNPDIVSHKAPEINTLLDVLSKKNPHGYKTLLQQFKGLSAWLAPQNIASSLLNGDYDELEKLVEKDMTCAFPSFRLNVFHLAALVGNSKIWELLKRRCSDAEMLLQQPDQVLGLLPGGYVYLSDHTDLKHTANATHLMYPPGYTETGYCYFAPLIWGGVTFVGTRKGIDAAVEWLLHNPAQPVVAQQAAANNLNPWQAFLKIWTIKNIISATLGGSVGVGWNNLIEQKLRFPCGNYNDYTSINAKTPSLFTSLPQFEKYIMDKKDVYMRVGTSCNGRDTKIAGFTQPLIQSGGQYKEIIFSLCSYEDGQKRKLPLPKSFFDQYVGTAILGGLGFGARVYFQVWGG